MSYNLQKTKIKDKYITLILFSIVISVILVRVFSYPYDLPITHDGNNFFGLHSAVIPKTKVGNNNTIQAGMIVDKDLKNNEVIFHKFKEKIQIIKK